MAKQHWKAGTVLYPVPVVMVSCGNMEKEKNIVTVAWTGTINSDPPMTYISLRHSRHSYDIIKHSKGDKIKILLIEHPAFYQLSITDNGSCSFINNNGIGLINMKDRAESVGGIISFTPSSDGFRVFISVPKNKNN